MMEEKQEGADFAPPPPGKIGLKSLFKAFDALKFKDLHYLNICCIVNKFIDPPWDYPSLGLLMLYKRHIL